MGFARILVCLDGSESSAKAARYAIEMANRYGSKVIALNVIASQLGYAYSSGAFGAATPGGINDMLGKAREEANKWFEEVEGQGLAHGVKVETEIVASPTAVVQAIVDYAEKNKIDLIVTGTKGRSGFAKLLLGSVASGVVTYAACPVMVVK